MAEEKSRNCINCGTYVPDTDPDAGELKDGCVVCGRCAAGIRILYPAVKGTGTAVYSEWENGIRTSYSLDTDVMMDALDTVTAEECREAFGRADALRRKYAEEYGPVKGIFLADTNLRENFMRDVNKVITAVGSTNRTPREKVFTENHIIRGRCLYGRIAPHDRLEVTRREGIYILEPYSVRETSLTDTGGTIREGMYGELSLSGDVSFVYPGDILIVR